MVVVPNCPWRRSLAVDIFKFLFFLEGVHTGPEAVVRVRYQFLLGYEAMKWLFHEFFAFLEILKDFLAQREEPPVDPGACLSDVGNLLHGSVGSRLNEMKASPGFYTGKTCYLSVRLHPLDHVVEINI